jgi:putative GTP pyrophosphokinase
VGEAWSRSHVDKLGDELRDEDPLTEATFQELQRYFSTLEPFADETFAAIESTVDEFVRNTGVKEPAVTRRRLKTLTSTREKLRRQTTTLSQVQDLVGCRIVVDGLIEQDGLTPALALRFGSAALIQDRRSKPSHGYRAVHVIIRNGNRRFETQIRTWFQDDWANIVELMADRHGIQLKYGGGPESVRSELHKLSEGLSDMESVMRRFDDASAKGDLQVMKQHNGALQAVVARVRENLTALGNTQ